MEKKKRCGPRPPVDVGALAAPLLVAHGGLIVVPVRRDVGPQRGPLRRERDTHETGYVRSRRSISAVVSKWPIRTVDTSNALEHVSS